MKRKALGAVAAEITWIWAAGSGAQRQDRLARLTTERRLSLSDLLAILEILEGQASSCPVPMQHGRAPPRQSPSQFDGCDRPWPTLI